MRWNYLNAAPFKEIHDRWISPYATSGGAARAHEAGHGGGVRRAGRACILADWL